MKTVNEEAQQGRGMDPHAALRLLLAKHVKAPERGLEPILPAVMSGDDLRLLIETARMLGAQRDQLAMVASRYRYAMIEVAEHQQVTEEAAGRLSWAMAEDAEAIAAGREAPAMRWAAEAYKEHAKALAHMQAVEAGTSAFREHHHTDTGMCKTCDGHGYTQGPDGRRTLVCASCGGRG